MRQVENVAFALLIFLLAGCIYDGDNRCATNQVVDERQRCACLPGYVPDRDHGGCVVCGENEVADLGICVCAKNFARNGEGQPCLAVPDGLGKKCSASEPCTGSYDHCAPSTGGDSYCTAKGCTADADCPMGYDCVAGSPAGSPNYCKRPPTGQGKACMAAGDCNGLDSNYCESYILKACVIANCSVTEAGTCHSGLKCCDISKYGTAPGVPTTLCLALKECP